MTGKKSLVSSYDGTVRCCGDPGQSSSDTVSNKSMCSTSNRINDSDTITATSISASDSSTVPTFYLLNATSLVKQGAIECLAAELRALNVTVGIICETWFHIGLLDCVCSVSGFNLWRQDCQHRRGGGLAI